MDSINIYCNKFAGYVMRGQQLIQVPILNNEFYNAHYQNEKGPEDIASGPFAFILYSESVHENWK